MPPLFAKGRLRRVIGVAACAALAAGCGEVPTIVRQPRIDLQTMRIVIPSRNDTILLDAFSGAVTNGPIVTTDTNTAFVAEFLKADGTPQPLVTDADYRLDVRAENVNIVAFVATAPFAGNLRRVNAGSTRVVFQLFKRSDNIQEFVRGIPITVN